jgi:hypothetical protein
MTSTFIAFLMVFGGGVTNIDTANSFLLPAPQVQQQIQHRHQVKYYSYWRHSGHDRCSLQTTLHESNANDIVDDIWEKSDKSVSIDAESDLMMNLIGDDDEDSVSESSKVILACGTIAVLVAAGVLAVTMRNDLGLELSLEQLFNDPSNSFDTILEALGTMDAQKGMIYFASFYILAEILAIPAVRDFFGL